MATSAIAPLFLKKLSTEQLNKVQEVAKAIKVNVNWLLAVFYFESGKTFSTSIKNNIGSVGLIQFTRDKAGVTYKTIKGKRYELNAIATMSWDAQLDLIQLYYQEAIGSKTISSFEDLYMATFFPVAVGKPNTYVLQTSTLSASLIARQNPAFDTNKDNQITKGEVMEYFKKIYTSYGIDYNKYIGTATTGIFTIILTGLAVFFYTVVTINI